MSVGVVANAPPLLEVRDLTAIHPRQRGLFASSPALATADVALCGVSFALNAGESLAVVGESGSGKTTLVRSILRLLKPAVGQVLLGGTDLAILSPAELRVQRRNVALVFQDPISSLDPQMRVAEIIAEPLRVCAPELGAAGRRERVVAQLRAVGLDALYQTRRPGELSGGQAQRVAIARALIADPALLICDEPVSALDLALRAQVLDLLAAERTRRNLALLLVTHDLTAVWQLCERTLVLRRGAVVEQGATRELFAAPAQAYTRELLASALSTRNR